MGMTAGDYLHALQALLPEGMAWSRSPGAVLTQLLEGWAGLPAEIDAASDNLIQEVLPDGDIARWEGLLDLPLPEAGEQDESQRRNCVLARTMLEGRCEPSALVLLASYWGHQVEIHKVAPATCIGPCDADIAEGEAGLPCTSACTEPVVNWGWLFCVEVWVLTPTEIVVATCTSDCTDELGQWRDPALEANLRNAVPAHTFCRFRYPAAYYPQRDLLKEDGWALYPGLNGTSQIEQSQLRLTVEEGQIAAYSSAGSYTAPAATKQHQLTAPKIRMRVAYHDVADPGYNQLGLGLQTEDGSQRWSICADGTGNVHCIAHHTNQTLATGATLALDGTGWLEVEAGASLMVRFGPEGELATLYEVAGAPVLPIVFVYLRTLSGMELPIESIVDRVLVMEV